MSYATAKCSFCLNEGRSVSSYHSDDLVICISCVQRAWEILALPGDHRGGAKPLTKRQREILNFLAQYSAEHGYMPSFDEIAGRFGYSSLATVHEHLSNLERKMYIVRSYNEARAIQIVGAAV